MNIKFKSSGISWIGKIPSSWEVTKIKFVGSARNGLTYTPQDLTDESGILVLRASNIQNEKIDLNDNVYVSCKINSDLMVKNGDILICSTNGSKELVGKNAIIENDLRATFGSFMLNFRCDNPKYMFYVLNSEIFETYRWSFSTTTINQLTRQNFKNMKFPLPPLVEQKRISDYLDKKCGQIDGLRQSIKEKITNLKSYKNSLITKAVTGKLAISNEKLEMKNSGISWIGKIPSSWEVRPVFYIFEQRKNKNIFGQETNLLSLSYGKIIKKDINTSFGLLPENFYGYNIVEKDDIVLRLTDLQNDKKSLRVGLVLDNGIITSAYITLKPKINLNANFMYYLLHSYDIQKVFYNLGSGVRQSLTFDEFKKLKLLLPALAEQNKIVEFLDIKCKIIDDLIANLNRQDEILSEYKKSLIYECVTGKLAIKEQKCQIW